jgi:hypothetical protein
MPKGAAPVALGNLGVGVDHGLEKRLGLVILGSGLVDAAGGVSQTRHGDDLTEVEVRLGGVLQVGFDRFVRLARGLP